MKILCLNVWEGGRLKNEISEFLRAKCTDIDVFCFQEAYPGIRECLGNTYSSTHNEYVNSKYVSKSFQTHQMILLRKEYGLVSLRSALGNIPNTGHSLDITFTKGDQTYWFCNVHGINTPREKLDTEERLTATHAIVREAKAHPNTKRVILGDFNVLPDTESIKLFECNGFRNLIKEYNIETTRNHHVWDRVLPHEKQLHSSYVFVGPEVEIRRFEVLLDIVSDHQPLLLEIA